MTDEMIKAYTKRISNASRSELIVIMFDLFEQYVSDAETELNSGNADLFRKNVRSARKVINRMSDSLDFSFEMSKQLLSIYLFVNRQLLMMDIKGNLENMNSVKNIMIKLHDSFEEVSKTDNSGPLMKNVQIVYAGITYNKGDLNETLGDMSNNRGFSI